MGFISEFKQFAAKGNVVDLAVGVVIGASFGKIVTSFVNDLLMPPLGLILGGVNFKELKLTLKQAQMEGKKVAVEAVTLNYCNFIHSLVDFMIIAFAIFMMIKAINHLKFVKPPEPTPKDEAPLVTPQERLLTEIRDALIQNPK